MNVTTNIIADVARPNVLPMIWAKAGDSNSRYLNITIAANGIAQAIPPAANVRFNARRFDGQSKSFNGSVSDGIAHITLPDWLLEIDGLADCSVTIKVDDAVLTTLDFQIYVQAAQTNNLEKIVYYVTSNLVPGTYYLFIGNLPYSFTLTEIAPAGGVIAFDSTNMSATVYQNESRTGIVESGIAVTQQASGTFLPATGYDIPVWSGQGVSSVVSKPGVYGTDNVAGGIATGFQAVALGGMRPDKLDDPDRTPTSAEGIQSFAAGGCVHAYGDFSTAIGKDTRAYMRGSTAIGGGTEAGMTVVEFNDKFATAEQKATPGYDRTQINGGIEGMHIVDNSAEHYEYPHSYSFAFAIGQDSKAKGRVAFASGNNNQASGWYSFVANSKNTVNATKGTAFGDSNVLYDNAEGAFVKGKLNEGYSSFGDSAGYNNVIGNSSGIVDYPNGPKSQSDRTFRAVRYPVRTTPAGIGVYSTVKGLGNEVYAANCVVAGVQNYTDAYTSFISGYRNIVRAASLSGIQTDLFYATVFGGTNYVHGNARYSFTAGSDNDVSGNQAAAIGKQHVVEDDRAVCLNAYNISGRSAQTVVGQYNQKSTTGMFVVGNGSSMSNRKNALVVHNDGRTTLGAAPMEGMDAVTLLYLQQNYVGKQDYATSTKYGVVKANSPYGTTIKSGYVATVKADVIDMKLGNHLYHIISPFNEYQAVFYGLSKAAGVDLADSTSEVIPTKSDLGYTAGVYPAAAIQAILKMLLPAGSMADGNYDLVRTVLNGEVTFSWVART